MSTLNTDCVNLPDTPRATVRDACELPDRELLRRFSAGRDADAFEQLVRRHGPMVLGVCRRMLRDADAADDAFQATFLVLVRKAASLRRPELLGNWLYGVAVRIATRRESRLPSGSIMKRGPKSWWNLQPQTTWSGVSCRPCSMKS